MKLKGNSVKKFLIANYKINNEIKRRFCQIYLFN